MESWNSGLNWKRISGQVQSACDIRIFTPQQRAHFLVLTIKFSSFNYYTWIHRKCVYSRHLLSQKFGKNSRLFRRRRQLNSIAPECRVVDNHLEFFLKFFYDEDDDNVHTSDGFNKHTIFKKNNPLHTKSSGVFENFDKDSRNSRQHYVEAILSNVSAQKRLLFELFDTHLEQNPQQMRRWRGQIEGGGHFGNEWIEIRIPMMELFEKCLQVVDFRTNLQKSIYPMTHIYILT